MTSDVLISVSGIQMGETKDAIEVIHKGRYYKKDAMHYVVFDEVMEGFEQITKNLFKFNEDYLAVTKKGVVNVNMEFQNGKKTMNCYTTPFGDIMMGFDTHSVTLTEEEDCIAISAKYSLEANYEFLANCTVQIEIKAQESGITLLK